MVETSISFLIGIHTFKGRQHEHRIQIETPFNDCLLPRILLLQPPEQRERQRRERKSQLMPDIRTLLPNKLGNRPRIPRNLHPEGSTKESKAKSTNGAPSEWQKILLAPSIEVISTPSPAPEDEMFFRHNNDVNDCPVSNDTQEGLEGCFGEESSCATADDDSGDEAECYEDDARDTESPGTEVLCVHGEGVVVRDVVLITRSMDGK